jgi:hypothetical protein
MVGLFKALETTGGLKLSENGLTSTGELFDLNPTDDALAKAKTFYENPNFPNLNWQRLPWESPSYLRLVTSYSVILYELNNLPPNVFNPRNPNYKKKILKEKLSSILKHVPGRREVSRVLGDITDGDLTKWDKLSKKNLAVNLVAHIYKLSIPNTRKYLAEARKRYPREAKWWKHGLQMIESVNPQTSANLSLT